MRKFRFRSYLDDSLFVVLVMVAAAASAAMEAGAMVGALPSAVAYAGPASTQQAGASAVQIVARSNVSTRQTR